MKTVGVLALQGAFREHKQSLIKCGVDVVEVRKLEDLDKCSALIIPGGESTTIGKLLIEWNLMEAIKKRVQEGMPLFGTCAGMILMSKDIRDSNQPRLGLLDVEVVRNAYGRQVDSFEMDLTIEGLDEPFSSVFIRAPYITKVGPGVQILSKHDDKIVMARQGKLLGCSFHPELTDDLRIHQYFVDMIDE
ncbi:pyridoxal 5'-phosphate synthase glutaminase subunit PdxT [Desulfitibacter alkalitolerans]|uniref:pyridoxal 5'-phosphate synthase glutaminase subunit PdxT n=1 Tax=Desulfitibacter alkalitolerans TaxID=264641 RepID=UPI00048506EB|nr:pyridoxal 5'-phosphate synthase glutaminase subunit PdxT [Desulfitibacter alkalitolerans]